MNVRAKCDAYWRLMRFDKPVGILLLWLPTAWALWIANNGSPSIKLVLYFLLGTFCMRAAGCVMNDMADRHIDPHVARTRTRPLAAGDMNLLEAFVCLFVLLLIALVIVMQLPLSCLYYALFAVLISILYPFCKRFLQAPQLVLGLAFSMGIPMAYVASGVKLDLTTGLLFCLNFAWIVAYDTLYAMVDREDDLRIGVKSTAVLFATYDQCMVLFLHIIVQSLWLVLAYIHHYHLCFYVCWLLACVNLAYQHVLVKRRETTAYFKAFLVNTWYGGLMWLGVMLTR